MTTIEKEFNSRISVLVVDDNLDLASTTAMLLRVLGFRVQICNSGKECIGLAQAMEPHVILMDLDMPVIDGYETCNHIRSQDWGSNFRIIAYSGRDSETTKKAVGSHGFDSFLLKPASYQDLCGTIISTITQRHDAI